MKVNGADYDETHGQIHGPFEFKLDHLSPPVMIYTRCPKENSVIIGPDFDRGLFYTLTDREKSFKQKIEVQQ